MKSPGRRPARTTWLAIGLFFAVLNHPLPGLAQSKTPITAFKLTSVKGYYQSSNLMDDVTTQRNGPGSQISKQRQLDFRNEIIIDTSSYVYHPNLLSLEMSAGTALENNSLKRENLDQQNTKGLYTLAVRANILREKPYRGMLFYERRNPLQQVSSGEATTTLSSHYGMQFQLLDPITPVPVQFKASRRENQTNGTLRFSEDITDKVEVRASRNHGALGRTTVQVRTTSRDSASGSPNLPVQRSRQRSDAIDVRTQLKFGAQKKYDLTGNVALSRDQIALERASVPDRLDLRFSLILRAQHSDTLRSSATLTHTKAEQGMQRSGTDAATAGVTWQASRDWWFSGASHAERNTTGRSETRAVGADSSARWRKKLPVGEANVRYAAGYEQRTERADRTSLPIIGERVVLSGFAETSLAREQIVTASIRVSNNTRTQTYVPNVDYELSEVGTTIRIRRLVGSNIFDGEEVLLDYSRNLGGSFASTQLDQNLSLTWSLSPGLQAGYRYHSAKPHVTSGRPDFVLNRVESHVVFARAEAALNESFDLRLGGDAEFENRTETVDSFQRDTEQVYLSGTVPYLSATRFRFGLRRQNIKRDSGQGQSNLHAADFRLTSRPMWGVSLTADSSYEKDTASRLPRSRWASSLRAQWRYRKVSASGNIVHQRERQGEVKRNRTYALLTVRRDF